MEITEQGPGAALQTSMRIYEMLYYGAVRFISLAIRDGSNVRAT